MSNPLQSDPPSYGPTQTEKWLECPSLRRFDKEWEVRGPWKPHLALGAAFSSALALYLKSPGDEGYEAGLGAGKATLTSRFVEGEEWTLEALSQLLERGFNKATQTTLKEMLEMENVIGTEVSIDGGRLDLVTERKSDRLLVVTDHKMTLQLQTKYVPERLSQNDLSWQLWDYAWRASNYYARPVAQIRTHLIVLSPTCRCYTQEANIDPENLEAWAASAKRFWRQMEIEDQLPFQFVPIRTLHCIHPRYKTRCPAFDACHLLHKDETKMEVMYIRKEKR